MFDNKWVGRAAIAGLGVSLVLLPGIAHAQSVDPSTVLTTILTYLTTTFGRVAAAVAIAVVGLGVMIGHHPMAGIVIVVVGLFMIFGAQFYVTSWFGGG